MLFLHMSGNDNQACQKGPLNAPEFQVGPSAHGGYFPVVLNGEKDTELEKKRQPTKKGGKYSFRYWYHNIRSQEYLHTDQSEPAG